MRLQLTRTAVTCGLALTVLTGALPARAEWSGGVDGRSSIYQDTDRTTIWTTIVGAHVSPKDVITFNGHYLADIITSASIDVLSSATTRAQCLTPSPSTPIDQCKQQPFHETRHEGAGSFVYADGSNTATLGYVYSKENDWRSHSFSASYARDLLNKQLTLGIGGSFTTNDVWRSHDESFRRSLNQGSVSLNAGIVGSKRDFISLDYTLMYLRGYQASPYRSVAYGCPAPHTRDDWFSCGLVDAMGQHPPETVPDQRIRHAVAVRWNRHVFQDTVFKTHLRGYVDSWGVLSATAGTEYVVGFGDLELGVFVRGYAQKGATFWQDIYDQKRKYMTADRELSPFIDGFGGIRFGYLRDRRLAFFESLHAEVKVTGFAFKFLDFVRLPHREGIVGEIALGASL
ncbi:MAG: DUF3570 domain-containing protein [Minicystis sp.]